MAMVNDSPNSIRSSAMSDVFIVLFTFLCTSDWLLAQVNERMPIGFLQSDPHWHYLCVLALTCPLVEYFASPTPSFHLIRAVRFLSRM